MVIASIMTGTSVDGVDISVWNMTTNKSLGFFEFSFTPEIQKYIKSFLWPNKKNMAEISEFNFKFSKIVSKKFMNIDVDLRKQVEYVVYHGQTVFHDPNMIFTETPSTLQLGSGAVLANEIGINVISDLRSSDVSVGGQGAPLVTFGDKNLFWQSNQKTFIFNIGGISNVSVIDPNGDVRGYDLGVGNSLIDKLMMKWWGLPYDKNAKKALSGKFDKELFKKLLNVDKFLFKSPPKSTGREVYTLKLIDNLIANCKKEDVIHTLAYYVAYTINTVFSFEKADGDAKFLVAGGGACNPLIMKYIRKFIPTIKLTSEEGVGVKEREAAAFAFLGYFYLKNWRIGSTTGAKKWTIPGALYKK